MEKLLSRENDLITEFNTFLPANYKIIVSGLLFGA